MADIKIKNRRYSFYQLFIDGSEEHPGNYTLSIPKIQRDYAQGRNNEKATTIRKEFLKELHGYINNGGRNDLDFVYGTSENDGNGHEIFVPLDGQQRLTTLFLIHWYLAKKCQETECAQHFFNSISYVSGNGVKHSHFTYNTRNSSIDFCDSLIRENIELPQKSNDTNAIEQYLKDQSWFYPEWELDPTIQSMLVMLDAINNEFGGEENPEKLLEKLMDKDNAPITFIFMDLNEYNLTDDLYIKMNSRGKPLTDFENFKAKLEEKIGSLQEDEVFKELKAEIEQDSDKTGITSIKQYFSFYIDTNWTNLFWSYCQDEIKSLDKLTDAEREKSLQNMLDSKISYFVKHMFADAYALEKRNEIPAILTKGSDLVFNNLNDNDIITPFSVNYLINTFNLFVNEKDKIKEIVPDIKSFKENELFEKIIKGDVIGFVERARLFAYIQYRLEIGDEKEFLTEWMQFIINITRQFNGKDILNSNYYECINTILSYLKDMRDNKTKSISELLRDNGISSIGFFEIYQIQEERIKARLRTDDIWKELIDNLEIHPYFQGQIGFILKMSDVTNIDMNMPLVEYVNKASTYTEKFKKYAVIASEVFSGGYLERTLSEEALLERAILTKYPNYAQYDNGWGNFLNTKSNKSNVRRDHSWKRKLRDFLTPGKEFKCVKGVIDSIINRYEAIDEAKVSNYLQEIIDNHEQKFDETSLLIKYPYLMRHCENGFFNHWNKLLILHSSVSYSAWDWEAFTIVLFKEYMRNKDGSAIRGFENFNYTTHNAQRDETPSHIYANINEGKYSVTLSLFIQASESEPYFYVRVHRKSTNDEEICEEYNKILNAKGLKQVTGYQNRHQIEFIGKGFNEVANELKQLYEGISNAIHEISSHEENELESTN